MSPPIQDSAIFGIDDSLAMGDSALSRIMPVMMDAIEAKASNLAEHVVNLLYLGSEVYGASRIPTAFRKWRPFERIELLQGHGDTWRW